MGRVGSWIDTNFQPKVYDSQKVEPGIFMCFLIRRQVTAVYYTKMTQNYSGLNKGIYSKLHQMQHVAMSIPDSTMCCFVVTGLSVNNWNFPYSSPNPWCVSNVESGMNMESSVLYKWSYKFWPFQGMASIRL